MNTSQLLELLNELLSVIQQDNRSHEARLVDVKNRLYQQRTALTLNRHLFAEKPVKQEKDGDILFA